VLFKTNGPPFVRNVREYVPEGILRQVKALVGVAKTPIARCVCTIDSLSLILAREQTGNKSTYGTR